MNQTKTTFLNLFTLVKEGVLTNNSIALYLYYKLHRGEATPLKDLREYLSLSNSSIAVHNKILIALNLVVLKNKGVGKPNVPVRVNELTNVEEVLTNDAILYNISKLRDNRYHKYSPKGYSVIDKKLLNNKKINKKRGGVTVHDTEIECPVQLQVLLDALPEEHSTFRVTPHYLNKLLKLSESIDIKKYAEWFVKCKLGKTVDGFSLGIFLYEGILREYKRVKAKLERIEKRKRTKSNGYRFSSKKIEEEFGNVEL